MFLLVGFNIQCKRGSCLYCKDALTKEKWISTYIHVVLLAAYAASAVLCVRDRTIIPIQPRLEPKPAHMDFGLQPYVALLCCF